MKKFKIFITVFITFLVLGIVNIKAQTGVISINAIEDLAKIGVDKNYPLNGNYKLTSNIAINESWSVIENAFTGSFDGNGKTISYTVKLDPKSTPKQNKTHMIFNTVQNAEFKNINFVVDTVNMRAPFAYNAINTLFENINISGKMESPDQMGGLVLLAESGTKFKNVSSSVDFKLKDLNFSKYYVIVGGIAGQITTSDKDTNYEFNKGSNNKYAVVFENSTFDGTFTTDFTNVVTGTRFYYLGGLFGCTTYASPVSYFATKIINSISNPTYNYTGTLPSEVTQYYYVNSNNDLLATYSQGNIGGNAKPISELKTIGRVHQNINLELIKKDLTYVTYGYYGNDNVANTTGGDGSETWSTISAPSLASIASDTNKNNGKIISLDSSIIYEYKLKSATKYTTVTSKTEIIGLAPGIYQVRIKNDNAKITEIEVKESIAPVVNITPPTSSEILPVIKTDTAGFPEEAKKALNEGTASLVVEITNVALNDKANQSDIDNFKAGLSANEKLDIIFDINLILNYDGGSTNIKELSTPKSFTIDIPQHLQNKGYSFFLMNNHDGTINKINGVLSEDGKKLTFSANKFSLYALSYKTEEPNPNTGDGIMSSILLGGISIIGIAGCGLFLNKKRKIN